MLGLCLLYMFITRWRETRRPRDGGPGLAPGLGVVGQGLGRGNGGGGMIETVNFCLFLYDVFYMMMMSEEYCVLRVIDAATTTTTEGRHIR